MELEEQMADAAESRYPGRAIHLHEKLSSPARKKEPHETFRCSDRVWCILFKLKTYYHFI